MIATMDGASLREHRERYQLTQAAVAEAAGMRQPDIAAIEAGRRKSPDALERVGRAIRRLARPSAALERGGLRDQVRQVLQEAGASDIRIFGSVARGTDLPGSDLDIIASFPPGFDLFDVLEVEEAVEDLLGVRVDVISDDPRSDYALTEARQQAVPL